MTSIPRQLVLQVPAQAHKESDWRGQFTWMYTLTIEVGENVHQLAGTGEIVTDEFGNRLVVANTRLFSRSPAVSLVVDATTGSTLVTPPRQRCDRVRALPPVATVERDLRRRFYPGDDEVFRFPISHVSYAEPGTWVQAVDGRVAPAQPQWFAREYAGGVPYAIHSQKFLYVNLKADDRAKLIVWLDAMHEEGVLT